MKPRSRFRSKVLFVTVGSTRFDKLISTILSDKSINQIIDLGFTKIILQVGQSGYDHRDFDRLRGSSSRHTDLELYKYKNSIAKDIEEADVIVGHAGAGTCLEALRANKKLLLVVNDTLMDNHQSELADQLAQDNYVVKTNVENFHQDLAYISDGETRLNQFPPRDPTKFEEIFSEALKKVVSRL